MEWFLQLPLLSQFGLVYIIVINLVTFFAFGLDKIKAHWQHRRLSEKMLWGLSLIGGSVGALLGMHFFRHKTKKTSFQAGMAVILIIQVAIVYWVVTR